MSIDMRNLLMVDVLHVAPRTLKLDFAKKNTTSCYHIISHHIFFSFHHIPSHPHHLTPNHITILLTLVLAVDITPLRYKYHTSTLWISHLYASSPTKEKMFRNASSILNHNQEKTRRSSGVENFPLEISTHRPHALIRPRTPTQAHVRQRKCACLRTHP